MAEIIRWIFRIVIPTLMLSWGLWEIWQIWSAGWIWHGLHSAVAMTVGLVGLAWLVEDLRELFKAKT